VAITLLKSLAPSSQKQYSFGLHQWWLFRKGEIHNMFVSQLSTVLSFLNNFIQNGCGYSKLNTIRCALSLVLSDIDGFRVGDHPSIKRLLKAGYRENIPSPRYQSTWDPSIVLDYCKAQFPHELLDLKMLTFKLIVLLALGTAQRAQTLSFIRLSNLEVHNEFIQVRITDLIKTSRPKGKQPVLTLPFFTEKPELCIAKLLEEYINRTASIRGGEDRIFISFSKPHKCVSSQTISRWIKTMLKLCGIDTDVFKAHSTRHASTSRAYSLGLDIEEIRKAAGWTSSSSVFQKFYNRPVSDNFSYARSVLNIDLE